jgi:hypothetical protein
LKSTEAQVCGMIPVDKQPMWYYATYQQGV